MTYRDSRFRISGLLGAALVFACCILPTRSHASVSWPQEVQADEGTIVVYQPQPESLQGDTLSGRSAMQIVLNNDDAPIFGVFWFTARIDTNRDDGTVLVRDLTVTRVRWPDSKDAAEQRFTRLVEGAVPQAGFLISLERLSSSLANAEVAQHSLEQLNNDPPVILFERQLAVLLLYDGEPRFKDVDDSNYERALNTPLLVVRNKKDQQ